MSGAAALRLAGHRELARHLPDLMRIAALAGDGDALGLLDQRLTQVLTKLIDRTDGTERASFQQVWDQLQESFDLLETTGIRRSGHAWPIIAERIRQVSHGPDAAAETDVWTSLSADRESGRRHGEELFGPSIAPQRRRQIAERVARWDRTMADGRLDEARALVPVSDDALGDPYDQAAIQLARYPSRSGDARPARLTPHPHLRDGRALETSLADLFVGRFGGTVAYQAHLDDAESDLTIEFDYEDWLSGFGLTLRLIDVR